MPRPQACPCTSGSPYATCCAPFHRGARVPPDAVSLMRSRFSAFALKDVDYLWLTLHPDHEDRARAAADVHRELRAACSENRYMALRILDTAEPDADGIARVLFAARVFRRGHEVSFIECSEFAREGDAWLYLGGQGLNVAFESITETSIERFLARD